MVAKLKTAAMQDNDVSFRVCIVVPMIEALPRARNSMMHAAKHLWGMH